MKRIKHRLIEQELLFTRNEYINLVIENPRFFRDFVYGVKAQIEEDESYVIYESNGKEASLGKDAFLLFSPFEDLIDEKKESTIIQKELTKRLSDQQKDHFNSIINDIVSFVNEISSDYPVPVEIDTDVTVGTFLKSVSLKAKNDEDEFLNRLLNYCKRIATTQKKSLFVLISPTDYLLEEEIVILFEELLKLDSDLWLISGNITKPIGKNERRILIDFDLCEL